MYNVLILTSCKLPMSPEPLKTNGTDLVWDAWGEEEKYEHWGDVGGLAPSTLLLSYLVGSMWFSNSFVRHKMITIMWKSQPWIRHCGWKSKVQPFAGPYNMVIIFVIKLLIPWQATLWRRHWSLTSKGEKISKLCPFSVCRIRCWSYDVPRTEEGTAVKSRELDIIFSGCVANKEWFLKKIRWRLLMKAAFGWPTMVIKIIKAKPMLLCVSI